MREPLDNLPEAAWRRRLVRIHGAAEYVDTSVYEIRRLLKLGQFPKPRRPNGRQFYWQLGQLADYSDEIFRKPE
jgi:predicted DNA-binding transcriptional regulator AlpA